MSFESMSVPELRDVAKNFGVELLPTATKDNIVTELTEMGVTHEMYVSFAKAQEHEREQAAAAKKQTRKKTATTASTPDEPEQVLLKMERENGLFEVLHYRFTRENPFQLVDSDDADYIRQNWEGFRTAYASEVADYYS